MKCRRLQSFILVYIDIPAAWEGEVRSGYRLDFGETAPPKPPNDQRICEKLYAYGKLLGEILSHSFAKVRSVLLWHSAKRDGRNAGFFLFACETLCTIYIFNYDI